MAKSISLVPILPVVHIMVESLLVKPVQMDTVKVHWQHENDGSTDGSINVSSDVLIVKGDIDPSSSERYSLNLSEMQFSDLQISTPDISIFLRDI